MNKRVMAGPTEEAKGKWRKETAGRKTLPQEFLMKLTDSTGADNFYRIKNAELLSGDGSSCMCYLVSVEMSENESHRMLLKQFYPAAAAPESVKINGLELTIDGFEENEALKRLADHFASAYELQRELSNVDELRSCVVTPYRRYFSGSTMYVLYQRENGDTLDRYFPKSAEEFLKIAISIAEAMAALHKRHILYMDFKPENILWADGSRAMLFDFDAAVDLTRLKDVREIRTTSRILAPELRNPDDHEKNKALFLAPSADIYSYGASLIAILTGLWPAEADSPEVWKKAAYETYNSEFRGQLTGEEMARLTDILARCTAEDLMVRYRSAEEILKDLRKLQNENLRGKKAGRRAPLEAERLLTTAYVMEENPLWKYRKPGDDGGMIIDAGLVGDGDTALRFFKYFLNSQIIDTAQVIRWALPDPRRKMTELMRTMPQLGNAAVFFINGEEIYGWDGTEIGFDSRILTEPIAYIFLETWDPAIDSAEDLFLLWSRPEDYSLLPSWIIFADEEKEEVPSGSRRKTTQNKELAIRFLEEVANNNGLTPNRGNGRFYPVFVGYADGSDAPGTRNAGLTEETHARILSDMRTALCGGEADYEAEGALEHLSKWVTLSSVGSSRGDGPRGKAYGRKMLERALKIHYFYKKAFDERASKEDIRKAFRQNYRYNLESSVCAALSLEEKLVSAGIDPKAPNAAFLYYEKVLSGTPEADRMLAKLMYLEHRRWTGCMIAAGFRAPTPEELEEYAYNGTNDHRDLVRKLHPLICASDPETGTVLRELPHKEWDAKKKWGKYDPLDRMSLTLHALCGQKAKRMDENYLTEELIADISKFELRGEWVRAAEWLRGVVGRMLSGEANINVVFADEIRAFRKKIEAIDGRRAAVRTELLEDIDRIESEMKAVVSRNQFIDYKMNDEAIVRGLPLLITQPIRRIYKPVAGMLWQNVMSSIIIEPEELVLIAENMDPQKAELLAEDVRSFLEKERQLNTRVSVIHGTDSVRTDERSKRAALDITGMDGADAFRFARRSCFQTMPVTHFKGGKLVDFGYGAEVALYSRQKHLTVDETLKLFGSNLFGEEQGGLMADLRPYYKQLWEAYMSVKPFYWRIFIQEMENVELGQYLKAAGEPCPKMSVESIPVAGRMLSDTGIRRVLREWKQTGVIEPGYEEPSGARIGPIRFETKNPEAEVVLAEMLRRADEDPYYHSFEAIQTMREPLTGKPVETLRHYVYDSTPIISFSFRDESVRDLSGRSVLKSEAIRDVLEALDAAGNAVRKVGGQPLISQDRKTGECFVKFEVDDIAIRQCFLKEGNVLETYVYHTIFQHVPVDDVRSNVEFTWNSKSDDDSTITGAINNEVDIVCTKNMKTFFISCKQSMPKNEYLQEIRFFADYFGIEGTAIIICSNQSLSGKKRPAALLSRSSGMDVFFIDRSMIGETPEERAKNALAQHLTEIILN